MLFNSIDFAIFLPIVFVLFWASVKYFPRLQNPILLGASLLFYGWWDWRFLFLLLFSSLVDFNLGQQIHKCNSLRKRRILLICSLTINLGLLGFFKYYNFFTENFVDAFEFFGQKFEVSRLNIILPVGISFYTFQTLSYTLDIYKKKLTPTKDAIAFFAFVSFFPQLVAGPIERATNLLPQFFEAKKFKYDQAIHGLRQILWGLFKKMVIADNCAQIADLYFNSPGDYSGVSLLIASIAFTFQIYCDFSGYSDIAIGTAKLFDFKLMQNFNFPYFSRNIAEFWRRWHISLSTWFRDYLYIPLGGSRGTFSKKIRNVFIIFVVSGFWHGANWTFIVWGALNAIYFLPSFIKGSNKKYSFQEKALTNNSFILNLKELFAILFTFSLTVLAWVFFRSNSLNDAFLTIYKIFFEFNSGYPLVKISNLYVVLILVLFFLSTEWFGRGNESALEKMTFLKFKWQRWVSYIIIILMIGIFSPTEETPFIYFQF